MKLRCIEATTVIKDTTRKLPLLSVLAKHAWGIET